MSKVYTSAVVIIPPKKIWNSIQEIRRKHDPQINRWMPHINLLYPFKSEDEFSALEARFREVCTTIQPFTIKLEEFWFFKHRYQTYTVWLKPEPKDKIVNFQKSLLPLVPNCNDVNSFKGGYIPHLSVGKFKGTYKIKRIINSLQKDWNEIEFLLDRIFFISREQNKSSSFTIKKEIMLKSG
ncbi:MAG: hypothetical protein GF383_00140 [Candidatus Lokiarchaeota archaeon]|nr:hypothetical protein [Candidatus Lokiarchaeota archaeon]MBD3337503.1 hypothetical protein [Candidatus Lokiarchaeota archaeon]